MLEPMLLNCKIKKNKMCRKKMKMTKDRYKILSEKIFKTQYLHNNVPRPNKKKYVVEKSNLQIIYTRAKKIVMYLHKKINRHIDIQLPLIISLRHECTKEGV